MQDLIKQERFELEVLDRLNSGKFLSNLVLGGGTMLRLCYGLNRFSLDLDFWTIKKLNQNKLYQELKKYLAQFYTLTDCANKFYTLIFEIKSRDYPRRLKLEIRKEKKKIRTAQAIAYSPYANTQVLLKVVSLLDMMQAKIGAFLKRKEIRDVFDMEFLLKKGVALNAPVKTLKQLLKEIASLGAGDYRVKLGSILEETQRKYYLRENFKILKSAIQEKLAI